MLRRVEAAAGLAMHVLTGDKIQIQPPFRKPVYLRPYPFLSILSGIKSPRILFLSLHRFRLLCPFSPSLSLSVFLSLCLSLSLSRFETLHPSFSVLLRSSRARASLWVQNGIDVPRWTRKEKERKEYKDRIRIPIV